MKSLTRTNEAVRRARQITTIVATVLSLAAVHGLAQEASTASITAATADFALQPPQLTITGTGFGSAKPVVDLDGLPLSLISFTSTLSWRNYLQIRRPARSCCK
jgi:hypothetical protein